MNEENEDREKINKMKKIRWKLIEESCQQEIKFNNWIPHYYPLILFHADCRSSHSFDLNQNVVVVWVIDWNLVWLIALIYGNYSEFILISILYAFNNKYNVIIPRIFLRGKLCNHIVWYGVRKKNIKIIQRKVIKWQLD